MLTVSGSDSSGCAGMQADNRAIHAVGAMPLNVITANTLQTPEGVLDLGLIEPVVVERHMRALLEAYQVAAIKIGMLGTAEHVEAVSKVLADFPEPFVVMDPVILSSSGRPLLDAQGIAALNAHLMPRVDLVTPNLDEQLHILPCEQTAVLVKGGHGSGSVCTDVLMTPEGDMHDFSETRIDTLNARGTGCVLSSFIAAYMAQGMSLLEAVAAAKASLHQALSLNMNRQYHGSGPSFA